MNALLVAPELPLSFFDWRSLSDYRLTKALNSPLPLLTVAALLPTNWNLKLVDLNVRLLTQDDWNWADIVMITGMIAQRERVLSLVGEGKARGKTVVVGGPYATACPQEVLSKDADLVVCGEAENTTDLLLDSLARHERGKIVSAEERPDIDRSPIPLFKLIRLQDYFLASIQTSRGCPFNCEFCDIVHLYGRQMRCKTPEQVLREFESVYQTGFRGDLFIIDDNFIGSRSHAKAVLQDLIPWMRTRHHPFMIGCQVSLNLADDHELMELMVQANFVTLYIGVESPDREVLAENRKYHNMAYSPVRALNRIRDMGLTVIAGFVVGFDAEKDRTYKDICTVVRESGVPLAMISLLQVLPGTALRKRLGEEGRLLDNESSGDFTGGQLTFTTTRPASQILHDYVAIHEEIYEPQNYLSRVAQYFLALAPSRRTLANLKGLRRLSEGYARNLSVAQTIRALTILLWRHGVRAGYRLNFWMSLIRVLIRNPSRVCLFLDYCGLGEDMFRLRSTVRNRILEQSNDRDPGIISSQGEVG